MNFHIPCLESTSLSVYIPIDAEITAAYVLTQKSYVKSSTAHNFIEAMWTLCIYFIFFLQNHQEGLCSLDLLNIYMINIKVWIFK